MSRVAPEPFWAERGAWARWQLPDFFDDAPPLSYIKFRSPRAPYFDTNVGDQSVTSFFEDTGWLLDIPGEHVAVSGLPKPPTGATIRRIDVIIRVDRNADPAAD
jgi:hypothetical protein